MVRNDSVPLGDHLSVSFERTLRIPDDGGTYPLPPSLGQFPILRVEDYADRVPASWLERGGVFIPTYQREALWLSFDGPHWHPTALKIGIGKVNAVSGKRWHERLNKRRNQDYVVCPDQPWLDGINAGDGYIRQFVAMPLGMGYTVEGQITGEEEFGGIQLMAVPAKPGRFPDRAPHRDPGIYREVMACYSPPAEMGIGAGGRMKQEIYPDEYGVDTWDLTRSTSLDVHIVNSMAYREITGQEPPPTPVSAEQYTRYGFPWFELYDEGRRDLRPSTALAGVASVKETDELKGFGSQQDDSSVEISSEQVVTVGVGQPG